jgi:Transposase and inactivated derivatives
VNTPVLCGFEADRDANAAWNIFSRGLTDLGVGHSEGTSPEIGDFWCANESPRDSSPPVETALAVGTTVVSAKRVVETGSPALSERVSASRLG